MLILNYVRLFIHVRLFAKHRNKEIIEADIRRWLKIYNVNLSVADGFVHLMVNYPEFRNVFYHRIDIKGGILNLLCPKVNSLFIQTKDIGKGFFIRNGISTIVNAKSIGENCYIDQQVILAFKRKNDLPVIADNVTIHAGAKVLGSIVVGNNSIIKPNAVVLKDVAPGSIMEGIPAISLN